MPVDRVLTITQHLQNEEEKRSAVHVVIKKNRNSRIHDVALLIRNQSINQSINQI